MNQQEFPNQKPSLIPFDMDKEQPSIIKVIGVGGGGSNANNSSNEIRIGSYFIPPIIRSYLQESGLSNAL